ncbi:MAG: purine-nucleoside phosphorylase [Planctomycetota bacterium]
MSIADDLKPALDSLASAGLNTSPRTAIILGSGFGQLEDQLLNKQSVSYTDIPGFPEPAGTAGHKCRLSTGSLSGHNVALFRGRYHFYEGHTAQQLAIPVRLAHALGVKSLLLTNAAGGIRDDLSPDSLMVITDHINLLGLNPLSGASRMHGAPRFPAMAGAYDTELTQKLKSAIESTGETANQGVYAAVPGPSFETAAEVNMLRVLGADAVGMSTVPEVITGQALGLKVAGLSLITNRAGSTNDSHEQTLLNAAENADRLTNVVSTLAGTI